MKTLHRFWWLNGGTRRTTYDGPLDWAAEKVEPEGSLGLLDLDNTEHGWESKDFPTTVIDVDETITVYMSEEHGYREWLWHTGMTSEQLTVFWESLPTALTHFNDPSKSMPGEWVEVTSHGDNLFSLIEGEEGSIKSLLMLPAECWSGHIHMDEDSYLTKPSGDMVLHQGHPSGEGTQRVG